MKWLAACIPIVAFAGSEADFFEMRVRPVLVKNCFACHTKSKMGGLDMSSRAGLLAGGKSGSALKPGAPDESLLLKAIRHEHERLKMPPSGGKLADDQIRDVAAWIKDGAVWPEKTAVAAAKPSDFWSFQPVREPKQKSIDLLWKSADAAAERRTLIRRVTYDLTGLPPSAEEVDAFLADKSAKAFEKQVDRLLASPHYGERWGRHWLDVARYSDDKLAPERDEPRPNSHFYRDWVIKAFNEDMPYDTFVKAHLAADLMDRKDLLPALGMYGLSPEFQDDRVDVTTRGFLGMTVACAQCHDHKFDPIPQRDFYALQGVFNSTEPHEYPLAEKQVVDAWDAQKKDLEKREQKLKDFVKLQSDSLADVFANQSAVYLEAARGGTAEGLDASLLERWKKYIEKKTKEHPFLTAEIKPADFQQLLLDANKEKNEVDEKNNITLGGSMKRGDLSQANLASLERNKFFLWRDFFGSNGVLVAANEKLEPYLAGQFKNHYERLKQSADDARKALPAQYPFLYGVSDKKDPQNMKIHVRGNPQNLGDEAQRAFLTVLGAKPFSKGSGRLELAEEIANKSNPLTARVMVNRIWLNHFGGEGLVKTPSNFGQLGERPSNPELLDYLAWRLMESGWSMKTLHREIVLSKAYRSARPQRERLSAEAMRDSILAVAGTLDRTIGGAALKLDEKNRRRTVYGFVSRRRLDPMLSLFDFPNPNQTSEQRIATDVPLQRLFLLNSPLVLQACDDLAKSFEGEKDKTLAAYRAMFARQPSARERKLAQEFKGGFAEYLQVLFSSDEFLYVN